MAADFIRIVEEGMEKSKTNFTPTAKKEVKPAPAPTPAPVVVDDIDDDEPPFSMDEAMDEESGMEFDFDAIRTEIRNKHKKATPEQKAEIKALRNGVTLDNIDDIEILTKMLEVFE